MKISCRWIFKGGKDNKQMLQKIRPNIQDMKPNEIIEMIINLLSKDETIRIIFETEK